MQVKCRTICMKSFVSVSRQYFVHLTIPSLQAGFLFEEYRDKSSANGTRKGDDVTRNDSQRRFLEQHIVVTLFQMVATLFQHCNAVLH